MVGADVRWEEARLVSNEVERDLGRGRVGTERGFENTTLRGNVWLELQ